MQAVVFRDIGEVALADVPRPQLEEPGDAIVRITRAAICGSDLHVLHGRIPGMTEGGIMGHEFTGVVEEVGSSVAKLRTGERVVGSFMLPCGTCWFCAKGYFNRCPDQRVFGYGAFFGALEGAQAEYLRVPQADLVLHPIGDLDEEKVLFVGDIFTTGLDAATEGRIAKGDVVAVQGCGPVGLMAIQCVKTFNPGEIYAFDSVPERLARAASFGAIPVNTSEVHPATYMQDHTDGRGADVVIECVGAVPALLQALDVVRAGGRISVIGVYAEPDMEFPLNVTFIRGIDIKFCGTANIIGRWDEALRLIEEGVVDPSSLISHRMPLSDAVEAYRMFDGREALKIVLIPGK